MSTTTIGEVLRPGDDGYEQHRRLWNGAVDRRPAMIARPRTAAEVASAVRMATSTGLEIAVRGGGHSIPGLSVVDGGLMIDLSAMKRVDVDPGARLARAEPGLLWREYDAATQAHGLASPGGEISHTGVAGLTLGGGIGWLSRRYGLAADNLVGAQVVLADGSIIDVDEDHELLWGLRGGGGNFGIVTEFRFRLHQVEPVFAGLAGWPASRTPEVLEQFLKLADDAPRDLSLVALQAVAPPAPFVPAELRLQPFVGVVAMWTGDPAEGQALLADLHRGAPLDTFGVQPYTDVQQSADDGVPHGRRYHLRSEWLIRLDTSVVDVLADAAAAMSSPFNQLLVRRLGGAIADVPDDATAFSFRGAQYMSTIVAGWDDGDGAPHAAWTRQTWEAMRPWSQGAGYVNHLDADEGRDRVRAAYGDATWERLVALKRRYDPGNVFHLNQNVDPT
ncbi:MAG: FAD-binding oxidoreductase [Actinomycetes bacterium]